jgi:hypothetical protein
MHLLMNRPAEVPTKSDQCRTFGAQQHDAAYPGLMAGPIQCRPFGPHCPNAPHIHPPRSATQGAAPSALNNAMQRIPASRGCLTIDVFVNIVSVSCLFPICDFARNQPLDSLSRPGLFNAGPSGLTARMRPISIRLEAQLKVPRLRPHRGDVPCPGPTAGLIFRFLPDGGRAGRAADGGVPGKGRPAKDPTHWRVAPATPGHKQSPPQFVRPQPAD